ncbi:MAG TPA: sulfotransferase [Myxococcota bacterium]|nr:sulfotransferase [Myxococcota bacterium]
MVVAPIHIDDLSEPRLPFALRALNALGGPIARWVLSLDPEDLLAAASARTGLTDYGDPSFREPLAVLLEAFEHDADLSAVGRISARGLVLQLLANRLRIEDLFRQHPEIEEERIERPIIIAGLPRTGTTHLHNLISQDPSLRSLPYWESLEPVPDPREAPRAASLAPRAEDGRRPAGWRDPRVVRCEKALTFLHRVMPLFPLMHEMTEDARHEEIQLLAIAFSTMLFESSYQVPSYAAWYKRSDQRPAYRYLRRCLQALQWLRGPKRWVLKSPQHLEQQAALIEIFPDAAFVQTHRDPVRITASLCTMIAYGSRMNARRVDPVKIGRYWAARTEDLLRGSIEGRAALPPAQVIDVHFRQFMKDDMATAERVLAFAGHPVSGEARAAIRKFMDANPRGKHGTIDYRLEDVGLDYAERRAALRFYRDHFDVEEEPA